MKSESLQTVIIELSNYLDGLINKNQFIQVLKDLEAVADWYFVFDVGRLLIQNLSFKIVVTINSDNQTYQVRHVEYEPVDPSAQLQSLTPKQVIAFSGPARNTSHNDELLYTVVASILSNYDPSQFAVLTGGYSQGVPQIAAVAAAGAGFDTIAVVPAIIHEIGFETWGAVYKQVVTVGEDWGDETPLFAALADTIYFLGGGFWTELEYREAQRLGKNIHFVDVSQYLVK